MGTAETKLVRVFQSLVGIGAQSSATILFLPLLELAYAYVAEQGRVSSANTPEVQLCSADGPVAVYYTARSVKLGLKVRTVARATGPQAVVMAVSRACVRLSRTSYILSADVNESH